MQKPDSERLYEQPIDSKTQVSKEFYGDTAAKYGHTNTYNRR